LQRGLGAYRPASAGAATLWRQLESDLRSWATALSSELRTVQLRAPMSRTWRVAARAGTLQAIALRELVRAAQVLAAG
jgi:hypothetical protein